MEPEVIIRMETAPRPAPPRTAQTNEKNPVSRKGLAIPFGFLRCFVVFRMWKESQAIPHEKTNPKI
jgi:hypothetical protein